MATKQEESSVKEKLNIEYCVIILNRRLMEMRTKDIGTEDMRMINTNIVSFFIACIGEFAKTYNLTIRDASNYLKRYKGLDFLITHYEAQHLLSIDDSVRDLSRICTNNGGELR